MSDDGGLPAPEQPSPPSGKPEFRLVPLDCPSCGAAVAAEGEDIVFYCTACRNGYRFDPRGNRLEPVEVAFVAAPGVSASQYKPFWLLPARVAIHERSAGGGGFSGFLHFFLGDREETGSAPGEGTFAVPAFRAPLESITALTRRYTQGLPGLGELLGERLLGGSYGEEDARRLAHYALIASQVEKRDTLKDLRYTIDFGPPRLLGVPFVRRGEDLVDALFGVPI